MKIEACNKEAIKRVVKYAFTHKYDLNEAVNLLRSKGITHVTEKMVENIYKKLRLVCIG